MLRPLIIRLAILLAFLSAPLQAAPPSAEPFELKEGDRVLFLGATLIEREGQTGYIEAALTARFADRNITFRNLGQSGDTVLADARNLNAGWANFGPPDQGFNRLKKLVAEIKPTVIIANYGMTESFEGAAKLPAFVSGYDRLLEMVAKEAGTNPRLVILSPNYHEDLGKPAPDPKQHNEDLKTYRDATAELAARHKARFVDLFTITEKLATEGSPRLLTNNGIHPTPEGYRMMAMELLKALGVPPQGELNNEKFEQLRQLIVDKNWQYFHYWRPQNDTYILGVRKKEQGKNAVEMPQFLPLVEAREKEIAAAKK